MAAHRVASFEPLLPPDVGTSMVRLCERDDLAARGLTGGKHPSDAELPDLLIDTYVRYPAPARAA